MDSDGLRLGRLLQAWTAWWKVMTAYHRVDGLKATCGLTACTPDDLRVQRSETSMEELYLFCSMLVQCKIKLWSFVFKSPRDVTVGIIMAS